MSRTSTFTKLCIVPVVIASLFFGLFVPLQPAQAQTSSEQAQIESLRSVIETLLQTVIALLQLSTQRGVDIGIDLSDVPGVDIDEDIATDAVIDAEAALAAAEERIDDNDDLNARDKILLSRELDDLRDELNDTDYGDDEEWEDLYALAQDISEQANDIVPAPAPEVGIQLPPVGGATCTTVFARSLVLEDEGEDVRALQRFLNSDLDTRIMLFNEQTGILEPMTLGAETTFFGERTKEALARYHAKYMPQVAVADRGIFGPQTRSDINVRCGTAIPVEPGGGIGTGGDIILPVLDPDAPPAAPGGVGSDSSNGSMSVSNLDVLFEYDLGFPGDMVDLENFFLPVTSVTVTRNGVSGSVNNELRILANTLVRQNDATVAGGYVIEFSNSSESAKIGLNIGGEFITDTGAGGGTTGGDTGTGTGTGGGTTGGGTGGDDNNNNNGASGDNNNNSGDDNNNGTNDNDVPLTERTESSTINNGNNLNFSRLSYVSGTPSASCAADRKVTISYSALTGQVTITPVHERENITNGTCTMVYEKAGERLTQTLTFINFPGEAIVVEEPVTVGTQTSPEIITLPTITLTNPTRNANGSIVNSGIKIRTTELGNTKVCTDYNMRSYQTAVQVAGISVDKVLCSSFGPELEFTLDADKTPGNYEYRVKVWANPKTNSQQDYYFQLVQPITVTGGATAAALPTCQSRIDYVKENTAAYNEAKTNYENGTPNVVTSRAYVELLYWQLLNRAAVNQAGQSENFYTLRMQATPPMSPDAVANLMLLAPEIGSNGVCTK